MSTIPGWYPDPGGAYGQFRYWDGKSWSPTTSSTPGGPSTGDKPPKRKSSLTGMLLIGALVIVLVGGLLFGLSKLGLIGGDKDKSSNPTGEVCPRNNNANASVDPHPNDGRVHGGQLSYPMLGAPWGPVEVDPRVPFGRDARSQNITIEPDYKPGTNWVASVLVGELVTGDGFFSPQVGMDIVAKCIAGAFYGDAKVDRLDVTNKGVTIDGHPGWMLEMHLGFDIPGLQAKGETAIIIIVNTGENSNSIYYASIPDNAQQYLPTARSLVNQLRVGA